VKLLLAILAVVLLAPVALVLAVALGPVILGVLCALICGLFVFGVWSLLLGLGWFGRSVERAGLRRTHHARVSRSKT
jgi:hypothetical protein